MTRVMLALLIMTTTAIGIRAQAPAPPGLVFAFELRAQVAPPLVVGEIAAGTRRIVQITGGTFEGPGFKGRVLPGGADWQIIHAGVRIMRQVGAYDAPLLPWVFSDRRVLSGNEKSYSRMKADRR